MRLKEQKLWDGWRTKRPKDFWLERIENMVSEGIPDVRVAWRPGGHTFVELKAPIAPKREATPLMKNDGLRISQINWHIKTHSLGGRSWVLIRDDRGRVLFVPGRLAAEMNQMSYGDLLAESYAHDLHQVYEVLRNEG